MPALLPPLLFPCLLVLAASVSPAAAMTAPDAAVTGAPRAATASETFEAVAVLAGRQLQVYLDRYASNEPVTGAQVGIDGAGLNGSAVESAPGIYTLPAPAFAAGRHGLTLTVETAQDADLLLLTLDVPADAGVDTVAPPTGWCTAAVAAIAALLVLAAVRGVAIRRRRLLRTSRGESIRNGARA